MKFASSPWSCETSWQLPRINVFAFELYSFEPDSLCWWKSHRPERRTMISSTYNQVGAIGITDSSRCHIKFWFMRPFPVVLWGQVILLQGAENFKNIWTLVCIGSDIFRRRFCSHGLIELLNAPLLMIVVVYWILIWQWEQIKTFGLSSFGQFFHLEQQWPERFSCSRCKCPNTRNALSAV